MTLDTPWGGDEARHYAEGQSNAVKEVDQALHPDGSNIVLLMMKSRGNPSVKAQADHILSMSIKRGELTTVLKSSGGKPLNAATALLLADNINSYNQRGESRAELLDGLSSIPLINRRQAGAGGGGDLNA